MKFIIDEVSERMDFKAFNDYLQKHSRLIYKPGKSLHMRMQLNTDGEITVTQVNDDEDLSNTVTDKPLLLTADVNKNYMEV